MEVEAHPTAPGGVPPFPQVRSVSADYFRALGVPLVAVAGVDATVPIGEVRLLSTIVNGSAARERFVALLLVSFGAVALILGAVGIYGVVSAHWRRHCARHGWIRLRPFGRSS